MAPKNTSNDSSVATGRMIALRIDCGIISCRNCEYLDTAPLKPVCRMFGDKLEEGTSTVGPMRCQDCVKADVEL